MNEEHAISLLHQLVKIENLNDLQELVFRLSWQNKTYRQIAEELNYDHDYIRNIGFHLWRSLSQKLGIKVTKKNVHSVLTDYVIHHFEAGEKNLQPAVIETPQQFRDWGEAVDTKIFFGRDAELEAVARWIVKDGCRLVGIFGIGGVGKTAFAAELIREIAQKFDYLIWRTLRNAPNIQSTLIDIIEFLAHQQETEFSLPEDLDGKLRKLLTYLHNNKCLIVLDNLESILQSCAGSYDCREGYYRSGYDGYGQLLEIVADTKHQSCFLVMGREIPHTFWSRIGDRDPTRYLQLTGLDIAESKKILQEGGILLGSSGEQGKLIDYYGGNPLALKIISASILDLFDGNLTEFWRTHNGLLGDINELLKQQCDRLSELEKDIMYWLALSRESLQISELKVKIFGNIYPRQLLTEIQSLKQRGLVEKNQQGFTLQPVIMDFFTQIFINKIEQEITTKKPKLLNSHAWLDACGKDYIKQNQIRFIFTPLIARLTTKFYPFPKLEAHLQQLLKLLQQSNDRSYGYGAGNLINLLQQLKINLIGYDFSNLTIWEADLKTVPLQQVNFSNCDFKNCKL